MNRQAINHNALINKLTTHSQLRFNFINKVFCKRWNGQRPASGDHWHPYLDHTHMQHLSAHLMCVYRRVFPGTFAEEGHPRPATYKTNVRDYKNYSLTTSTTASSYFEIKNKKNRVGTRSSLLRNNTQWTQERRYHLRVLPPLSATLLCSTELGRFPTDHSVSSK